MYLVIEKGILFFPLLLQLKAIETGVILLIVYITIFVFRKNPGSNSSCSIQQIKFVESFSKLIRLNLHETDLLYPYFEPSFDMALFVDFWFLTILVCCDHKIILHWYENQNKNNLVIMFHKSWEIIRNQLTISCQIVAYILKL